MAADSFLCDVLTENIDGTWDVRPKIVEVDGTNMIIIKAKPVGGIEPQTGDVAMVVTTRNNLDDAKINRWFEASDANARIVAIATPLLRYVFKGDYKIEGDLVIDGDLEVTGDLDVGGDVSIGTTLQPGNLDVSGDLDVGGDLDVDGETATGSLTIGGLDWLSHVHENNAPAPGPTGTGTQVGP